MDYFNWLVTMVGRVGLVVLAYLGVRALHAYLSGLFGGMLKPTKAELHISKALWSEMWRTPNGTYVVDTTINDKGETWVVGLHHSVVLSDVKPKAEVKKDKEDSDEGYW